MLNSVCVIKRLSEVDILLFFKINSLLIQYTHTLKAYGILSTAKGNVQKNDRRHKVS